MYPHVLFFYGPDVKRSRSLLQAIEQQSQYPVQCIDVQYSAHKGSFLVTKINQQCYLFLPPDINEFPCLVVYRGVTASQGGQRQRPFVYLTGEKIYQELGLQLPSASASSERESEEQEEDPRFAAAGNRQVPVPPSREDFASAATAASVSDFNRPSRNGGARRLTDEEMQDSLRQYQQQRDAVVPSYNPSAIVEGSSAAAGYRNGVSAGVPKSHRPAPPVLSKGFGI